MMKQLVGCGAAPLTLTLMLAACGQPDALSPQGGARSSNLGAQGVNGTPLVAGATYRLVSALSTPNNPLCLDVVGSRAVGGTNVQLYSCNNTTAQRWVLTEAPGNFATLRSAVSAPDRALCLDVSGGSVARGTNVQIWTCNALYPQAWKIEPSGNGAYKLRVQRSDYTTSNAALDVAGAVARPGTNVQIWDDLGNTAQQWRLERLGEGSAPTPTPAPPPMGAESTPGSNPGAWTQTFGDDFNSIDPGKWHKAWFCQNGDANCWFDGRFDSAYPEANTFVSGGALNLVTKREGVSASGQWRNFTSGALNTAGRFTQQYGYVEARMKPGSTNGNAPDFWLASPHGWPPEIDIAEFGGAHAGRVVGFNLHAGAGDAQASSGWKNASDMGLSNFNDSYHTYGLLWAADKIVWYVDGREVRRYTGGAVPDEPMYVIFSDENRSDDGGWFGNPAQGSYPQTTLVDWVKVYRKK